MVERGVRVLGGELIGGVNLVGGREPGEDNVSEGVSRVHGVVDGDGLVDAVDAGAASGNAEG
jgi:hypothetical protein